MRTVTLLAGAGALAVTVALPVRGHTVTDVVAVSSGSEATATFRPTHGCSGSPTLAVSVRTPMAGAVAQPVEGWSETSQPDDEDRTVLTWSDGVLPDDAEGAFPFVFAVPDRVGDLLLFPVIQTCENGQELSWVSGDPDAEYPAVRVLILAADADPAATIDDVPLDAPGRDQLEAVVDSDNPATTTTGATTTTDTSVVTTTIPESSTVVTTTTPPEVVPTSTPAQSSAAAPIVIAVVALAILIGFVVFRRRR